MALRYPQEIVDQCVDAVFVLGRSRSQVCADYGVSSSILSRWLQEATGAGGSGSGSHLRKADVSSDDPSELLKRVRELELENEFLKKPLPSSRKRKQNKGFRTDLHFC